MSQKKIMKKKPPEFYALLSRQPASGWPFQQRLGVVEWQPASGWPSRQRTGRRPRETVNAVGIAILREVNDLYFETPGRRRPRQEKNLF